MWRARSNTETERERPAISRERAVRVARAAIAGAYAIGGLVSPAVASRSVTAVSPTPRAPIGRRVDRAAGGATAALRGATRAVQRAIAQANDVAAVRVLHVPNDIDFFVAFAPASLETGRPPVRPAVLFHGQDVTMLVHALRRLRLARAGVGTGDGIDARWSVRFLRGDGSTALLLDAGALGDGLVVNGFRVDSEGDPVVDELLRLRPAFEPVR